MIRRIPIGAAPLLGLLLLSGCSFFSHSVTWSKSGVAEDQAQSDLATCTEEAKTQTDSDADIDHDIAATAAPSSGIDQTPIQNMQSFHSQNRFKSILEDCMSQLGYHKVD